MLTCWTALLMMPFNWVPPVLHLIPLRETYYSFLNGETGARSRYTLLSLVRRTKPCKQRDLGGALVRSAETSQGLFAVYGRSCERHASLGCEEHGPQHNNRRKAWQTNLRDQNSSQETHREEAFQNGCRGCQSDVSDPSSIGFVADSQTSESEHHAGNVRLFWKLCRHNNFTFPRCSDHRWDVPA